MTAARRERLGCAPRIVSWLIVGFAVACLMGCVLLAFLFVAGQAPFE